ncbi:hypothetical protein RSAG8_02675, partial [Rhizoctonia solani AG-8 WAC10335]
MYAFRVGRKRSGQLKREDRGTRLRNPCHYSPRASTASRIPLGRCEVEGHARTPRCGNYKDHWLGLRGVTAAHLGAEQLWNHYAYARGPPHVLA